MRKRIALGWVLALALGIGASPTRASADPLGTAFTYQGRLDRAGGPYTGAANLRFELFDVAADGTALGTVTLTDIVVKEGLFTVDLDFGIGAFAGEARWLQISVQSGTEPDYTTLLPRQSLRAAPYALYALSGAGGTSFALPFSGSVAVAGTDGFAIDHTAATGTQSALAGRTSSTDEASGVRGEAVAITGNAVGVLGSATASSQGVGVVGRGGAIGGRFESSASDTSNFTAGVTGVSSGTVGVRGMSSAASGGWFESLALDTSGATAGVVGVAANTFGVRGTSATSDGVVGETHDAAAHGGRFVNRAGGVALLADGLAQVRTLQILGGSDLAEPFDVADDPSRVAIEPGRVVVIDPANPGGLRLSNRPYDTKVAGILSGANGLSPGMVMKAEGVEHADGRYPVAMTGRVWCYADASFGAIAPGDLLTTSSTPGAAMRADPSRAAGAVLGKAMTALAKGRGLVLVLVSLQ